VATRWQARCQKTGKAQSVATDSRLVADATPPRAADDLNIHSAGGIKLKTKRPLDFVTQQLTIAPGGTTGWHSDPGPVLVTVKSGALTLVYADDPTCAGRTYHAGQSFVDRGDEVVHTALNRGTTPVELWATYLVPGCAGSAVPA
jgi:quercetin dioxygenase-like cupin family protein